jgi:hypothetical protein
MAARLERIDSRPRFVIYSDYPGAEQVRASHSIVCDWRFDHQRETRTLNLYVDPDPEHQKALLAKGQELIAQVPNLSPGEALDNVRLEPLKV